MPRGEEPYPREAEISVLGGLLLDDPDAAGVAFGAVGAMDFFRPAHRRIFRAARALHERGDPIDVVTLTEELRRTDRLEEAGGMEYLAELLDAVPTAANIEYHARLVRDAAERRRVRAFASELALEAGNAERSPAEVLAWSVERIQALQNGGPSGHGFPSPRSVEEILSEGEDEEGWIAEQLVPTAANVLVAGYPKTFKTFFVEELAVAAATGTPFLHRFEPGREHRVGLVLMEGGERRNAWRIERLARARGLTGQDLAGRLFVWYRPPLRFTEPPVVNELRRWADDLDLDLLAVDAWAYVAEGDSDDSDDVTPQLTAFSSLRDTCSGLTTLLVHHARKAGDGSSNRLTDIIRNSGAFGAWYDAGLVLTRKDEHSPVTVRPELRDHPSVEPFAFTVEDEEPATPGNEWTPQGWLRMEVSDLSPQTLDRQVQAQRFVQPIKEFLRDNPGANKTAIRRAVSGKNPDVEAALELISEAGGLRTEPGARNAILHYLVESPK